MKNPFSKKAPSQQEAFLRTYLDRIAPGVVKFEVDHYIFGSTYRCVWALREYPASTEAQALLRELGEKSGVTLRIYCRQVSPGEEDRIIDNANKKNKLDGSDPNKLRQAVAAESNLRDVAELVHKMHREHEPLVHCAVYLEMTADSKERLRQLQTDVLTELVRCKLNVDKLLLRQKQGFCCVIPVGSNVLGREFERVLPASSVADPKAAEEWQALKEKEAVARQRKKEREEERMAADPEYAAMMAERKAEYTRTRTAKRQAEREALVELAKTDEEAAKKLAEMRKYQSQATVRSYQKMKADAEAGDPDAIKRYETTLAKRREEYHRKKGA